MALVLTDRGEILLMRQLLPFLATCQLRLYVNDRVPGRTDDPLDYVEASWPGYAPATIGDWGPPFIDELERALSIGPPLHFLITVSPPVPIIVYGYFVTSGTDDLVYAERAPDPLQALTAAGELYTVQPRAYLRAEI